MALVENKKENRKPRSNAGNCPLEPLGVQAVSYKNPNLLRKFVSEKGRILPRRITGVSAKMQRRLKGEIQRARILGLLAISNS